MTAARDPLARVVAFQTALARRTAQTVVPLRAGFGVLDDRYPASYEHNRVYVTRRVSAGALLDETERLLRRRQHRYVSVLDDAVGRELAPRMLAAGYGREHDLLMVLAGAGDGAGGAVPVERVELEALRGAIQREWVEQWPDLAEDVVVQLFERRFATAAACDLTSHVVRVAGEVVAWCHLYRVGDEAQVESVVTLRAWRRRGFARAVVLDAVAAARETGCGFVFLVADQEDWPWRFYERLGFAGIGRQHTFVRAPRD
jgi:ribosomal protein S18 acetylase RimI-like enzyme